MHFTLSKISLTSTLEQCARISSLNKSIGILQFAKVTAIDASVTIEATSGDFSYTKKIASTDHEGSVTFLVEIAPLLKYIKMAPGEDLHFTITDTKLTVKQPKGYASFAICDTEKWPDNQMQQSDEYTELRLTDMGFFAEALANAPVFVGNDEYHPQFKSLNIETNNGIIAYNCTDSCKIIRNARNIDSNDKCSMLIAAPMLSIISSEIGNAESCVIRQREKSMEFDFGTTRIVQSKLNFNYPDVRRIIPDNVISIINVDRREIIAALKRISSSVAEAMATRMDIDYNSITFSITDSSSQRQVVEKIGCDSPIQAKVGIQASIAVDCLSVAKSDQVGIGYIENNRPIMIIDYTDERKCIMFMPMTL